MSLDNVPKTDWDTTTGVTNTQMNDIGNNLQSLEDSKLERNGDETLNTLEVTDSATIDTATISTIESATINNSGYVKSNYKSSDGSTGINGSFEALGGDTYTIKDGLIVLRTPAP